MVMSLSVSETRKFECLHGRLYGDAHRRYIELFPSCDRFCDSPATHAPARANERHPERAAVEAAHEAAAIAERTRRPQVAAQSGRRDGDDAIGGQQGAAGTRID